MRDPTNRGAQTSVLQRLFISQQGVSMPVSNRKIMGMNKNSCTSGAGMVVGGVMFSVGNQKSALTDGPHGFHVGPCVGGKGSLKVFHLFVRRN